MTDDTFAEDAAAEAANSEIEDQIDEISEWQNSNPSKYASDKVQRKLAALYAARYPGDVPGPALGPGGGAAETPAVEVSTDPTAADEQADTAFSDAAWAVLHEDDPQAAASLAEEWGEGFSDNIKLAREVTGAFADEPLVEVLETTGLGDHPAVLRFAAEIGKLRGSVSDSAAAMELVERAATEKFAGTSLKDVLEGSDLMAHPAILSAAERIGEFLVGAPAGEDEIDVSSKSHLRI